MSKDILQDIIAHKRYELQQLCAPKPSLHQALRQSPTGIIAEFKRRSPSKGWIKAEGHATEIPLAYEQAGAAAVSILTDEHFFGGSDDFIRGARQAGVTLPILYKNFIIDEVQLHQALLCGASAVLLIAACLSIKECTALIDKAHALGLEVLLEIHDEKELAYCNLPADCIGVNNRHLGTFVTDVEQSFRLADRLQQHLGHSCIEGDDTSPVLVSESGISDPATIRQLRSAGFRGFLIGETLMRAANPGTALQQFIREI